MRNRIEQSNRNIVKTELVGSSNPVRNQPCIARNLAEKDAKRVTMHPVEREIQVFRQQAKLRIAEASVGIFSKLNEWNNKN